MQQRFVAQYMRLRVASAAAREAGYGVHMAHRASEKILRHPSVAAEIARLESEVREQTLYSVETMTRALEQDIADAKKDKQHGAVAQNRTHISKLHKLIGPEIVVDFSVDLAAALEAAKKRVLDQPMIDVTPQIKQEPARVPPPVAPTAEDIFGD